VFDSQSTVVRILCGVRMLPPVAQGWRRGPCGGMLKSEHHDSEG
jgi:hypothetical protein